MRRVTRDNFRKDPLFPSVRDAVTRLLAEGDVISPIEVMIASGRLTPADRDRWRRGQVPYLESVVQSSLERISRLLRILAYHAESSKLKPSQTVYCRWGKGAKTRLRFSRSGEPALETAWSTCYVRQRPTGQAQTMPESPPDRTDKPEPAH